MTSPPHKATYKSTVGVQARTKMTPPTYEAAYKSTLAVQASMVLTFGPMSSVEIADKTDSDTLKQIIRNSQAFKEKKHRHCSSFEAIGIDDLHPLAQNLLHGAQFVQENFCDNQSF